MTQETLNAPYGEVLDSALKHQDRIDPTFFDLVLTPIHTNEEGITEYGATSPFTTDARDAVPASVSASAASRRSFNPFGPLGSDNPRSG